MDLWPQEIGTKVIDIRPPVLILRQQAILLGEKTQNLLKAEVVQNPRLHDRFSYSFQIVAPTLENYRYNLFDVWHGVQLYPVQVSLDETIAEEIRQRSGDWNFTTKSDLIVVDEEKGLIDLLREILRSQKTLRVIESLLALLDFVP